MIRGILHVKANNGTIYDVPVLCSQKNTSYMSYVTTKPNSYEYDVEFDDYSTVYLIGKADKFMDKYKDFMPDNAQLVSLDTVHLASPPYPLVLYNYIPMQASVQSLFKIQGASVAYSPKDFTSYKPTISVRFGCYTKKAPYQTTVTNQTFNVTISNVACNKPIKIVVAGTTNGATSGCTYTKTFQPNGVTTFSGTKTGSSGVNNALSFYTVNSITSNNDHSINPSTFLTQPAYSGCDSSGYYTITMYISLDDTMTNWKQLYTTSFKIDNKVATYGESDRYKDVTWTGTYTDVIF